MTLVLSGTLGYEDATGNKRTLTAGGFKWTSPGERVRHDSGRATGEPLRAFQLWTGLRQRRRALAAETRYLAPHEVQEEGPVQVILGQFGRARSALAHAAPDINYFHVRLRDGEHWRYVAPERHNVTWLAVDRGGVRRAGGRARLLRADRALRRLTRRDRVAGGSRDLVRAGLGETPCPPPGAGQRCRPRSVERFERVGTGTSLNYSWVSA